MVRVGQALTPSCRLAALGAAAALAAGCASPAMRVVDVTDRALRSIAAGDLHGTQDAFEGGVRATMTPRSFFALSRMLQSLGPYRFAQQLSALPNQRYDLEAYFSGGSLFVQLRLDPTGRIAALHLTPNFASTVSR